MKKHFALILICLLPLSLMAQPGGHGKGHHSVPPPSRHTISFESHHGESFSVFMDGELVNRMPQSRVMVSDVVDRIHEVVVILKRPVQKAAVLHLQPVDPSVVVNVSYDARTEQFSLYTPSHNNADWQQVRQPANYEDDNNRQVVIINNNVQSSSRDPHAHHPEGDHPDIRRVSDDDLNAMILRLKNQSFDSERLALGKVMVAASNLTASQIGRLAETIEFSSSQVEFLKYAYAYCIDKPNYYQATDGLTFSADKKKVLDFIATQK